MARRPWPRFSRATTEALARASPRRLRAAGTRCRRGRGLVRGRLPKRRRSLKRAMQRDDRSESRADLARQPDRRDSPGWERSYARGSGAALAAGFDDRGPARQSVSSDNADGCAPPRLPERRGRRHASACGGLAARWSDGLGEAGGRRLRRVDRSRSGQEDPACRHRMLELLRRPVRRARPLAHPRSSRTTGLRADASRVATSLGTTARPAERAYKTRTSRPNLEGIRVQVWPA
jgi:hypothetical protein